MLQGSDFVRQLSRSSPSDLRLSWFTFDRTGIQGKTDEIEPMGSIASMDVRCHVRLTSLTQPKFPVFVA